jgi:transcriptional regulator with XRE-family HTH domain
MLQISQNIKQERVSASRTQKEMADLLGISRSTYANWEVNTEPSYSDLKRIAGILNIDVRKLVGEDVPFTDANARQIAIAIRTEARVEVMMSYVAEIFAFQRGALTEKVREDMERMVRSALETDAGGS